MQLSLNIKCCLEYLQESHNTFFPYVLFSVGDRRTNEIDLPKRKLIASVWRIVLIDPLASLREMELDEDSDESYEEFLNPRTIIGSIRIDSLFSARNIPIIQTSLRCSRLSLSIWNNVTMAKHQTPELLERFTLKVEEHVRMTQQFCIINFGEINACLALHEDMEWKLYNELNVGVDVFDSSYLTTVPFIDRVSIKSYFECNGNKSTNICCVTIDKLRLHYGPTIGCALATASLIWQNILKDSEERNRLPILTRFVVCNVTSTAIKFGQDQTDEQIWLQPNECFYYAFRKETSPQKIRIGVKLEENIVDVNEAIALMAEQKVRSFAVAEGKFLLIEVRRISTTQKQIIIKGQIELFNMTQSSFQVHFKSRNQKSTDEEGGNDETNQSGILLAANTNGSFLGACSEVRNGSIRLQLNGNLANGWSGEIPLTKLTSVVPWLVKVPTKCERKFVTFCVRVHSENIDDSDRSTRSPKRMLIVVWPLFQARSLLPAIATAVDTECGKNYSLLGHGATKELQIGGTFDSEHELQLDIG